MSDHDFRSRDIARDHALAPAVHDLLCERAGNPKGRATDRAPLDRNVGFETRVWDVTQPSLPRVRD